MCGIVEYYFHSVQYPLRACKEKEIKVCAVIRSSHMCKKCVYTALIFL